MLLGNYTIANKNSGREYNPGSVQNYYRYSTYKLKNGSLVTDYSETAQVQSYMSLQEAFNGTSVDTSVWYIDDTAMVSATGGNLVLTTKTTAAYGGVYYLRRNSLLNRHVTSNVVDAGNQSLTSLEVYAVFLEHDSNTALAIMISNNTVYARRKSGGSWTNVASAAYSSSSQKHFRVREFNGTTYWDMSADKSAWTNIGSESNAIPMSSFTIGTFVGCYAAEGVQTTINIGSINVQSPLNKDQYSGLPNGYGVNYAYMLPQKAGGLVSKLENVTLAPFADGQMGVNIDSQATVTVTGSAVLQLVASLEANGTITVTATGDGVGVASSPATASVSVVGTMDIVGVGGLLAQATVVASPLADIQATGSMQSTVYLNQSEATVQQIVDAVWNALASEYNLTGTMGEKLNGAGSAGNPWTTDLSAYNTANTAGKILKDRLSKTQFLGLK